MSEAAAAPFVPEDLIHTTPIGSAENGPVRVEAINPDNIHVLHAANFAIQEAVKSPDAYGGKAPKNLKIKDVFVRSDEPHKIEAVYTYKDRRFGRKKHGVASMHDPVAFANDGADPQKAGEHVQVHDQVQAVRKGLLKRRTVIATTDDKGNHQRYGYNKWGNRRTVVLKDSQNEDDRELVRTKSLKPMIKKAKVLNHARRSLDRAHTYRGQKMAEEAERYKDLQASVEGYGPVPTNKDLNWELRDVLQVPETDAAAIRMAEHVVNGAFHEMVEAGDLEAQQVATMHARPNRPHLPPPARLEHKSRVQLDQPITPPPPGGEQFIKSSEQTGAGLKKPDTEALLDKELLLPEDFSKITDALFDSIAKSGKAKIQELRGPDGRTFGRFTVLPIDGGRGKVHTAVIAERAIPGVEGARTIDLIFQDGATGADYLGASMQVTDMNGKGQGGMVPLKRQPRGEYTPDNRQFDPYWTKAWVRNLTPHIIN